jgi:hypothetical protein
MQSGDDGAIQVTRLIPGLDLDRYQIEVTTATHCYHLTMRFSELRELFKNVRCVLVA